MTITSIFITSYYQGRFLAESVGSAVCQPDAEKNLIRDAKSTNRSDSSRADECRVGRTASQRACPSLSP